MISSLACGAPAGILVGHPNFCGCCNSTTIGPPATVQGKYPHYVWAPPMLRMTAIYFDTRFGLSSTSPVRWMLQVQGCFLSLRALKFSPVYKIYIGAISNSTQIIWPIHWKIWFLFNIEILRALRLKSSYAFWNDPPPPPGPATTTTMCVMCSGQSWQKRPNGKYQDYVYVRWEY